MPQIGERYVVRLRVAANKEPLEYVERPARDMAHRLLSSRRPDLYAPPVPSEKKKHSTSPITGIKTHASGPTLGHGKAVALHEGFLHGQHEV